jgi:hypothetical protein
MCVRLSSNSSILNNGLRASCGVSLNGKERPHFGTLGEGVKKGNRGACMGYSGTAKAGRGSKGREREVEGRGDKDHSLTNAPRPATIS